MIVLAAQRGDESAFTDIYRYFADPLGGYVARRVSGEDIEDVVSDVWVKITQSLQTYAPKEGGSFRAWFWRVAMTVVVDYYRKKKPETPMEDMDLPSLVDGMGDTPETPLEEYQRAQLSTRLHDAISTLPNGQRDIIEMSFLQDLTHAEISEITGKSEGNIRIIKMRALRDMRRLWETKPENSTED